MKITFFDCLEKEKEKYFELFKDNEVSSFREKLTKDNIHLANGSDIISVRVMSEIDKEIIDLLPNLKYIAARTVGFNNIDIEYAKSKGISISNIPDYGPHTIAEFAFGLLLNISRKIIKANTQLRENMDFSRVSLEGFDLKGKTLGVLGTGKIGKEVIKIAKGFGMKIVAYDVFLSEDFAKEMDFEYKELDEVLKESDVISVHIPYKKETYHLINKENISKMKKGVVLINTARGELVDTEALIWGLREGIVSGAGLDVLEEENKLRDEIKMVSFNQNEKDYKKLVEGHILIDMPQVIVTPHVAFFSRESVDSFIKTTKENIDGFISNNPVNLV
ncbi:MAG: NAD(P)-dependent oxidoreductase [Patescibacteria group bacterium]|nr:NAD(P)-dependent oxidoreductase [Patescibacteria group bacterium]